MEHSQLNIATLEGSLVEHFKAEHVSVIDLSGGCGQMFDITVVSAMFIGSTPLKRSRMVNEAISTEISMMHGYKLKTFTPEQWQKKALNN